MNIQPFELKLELNDFLLPSNPSEFFAPYKVSSEGMIVYSIIHTVAQRSFKEGEDATLSIDLNDISNGVKIKNLDVKKTIDELKETGFIKVKHVKGNTYEVTIPNFDTWAN